MCELFSCFESSMPNWANNPSYYKCIYCKYLHPYEFLWVAIMYIYVRKAFFVPCLRCLFEVTICWASVCLAAASMRIQAMYNLRIIFLNYTERTWECTKSVSTLWDQQLPWSDYTSSWNTNKVYSLNLSMKTKHLINSRSVTCGESLSVFIWLWNPVDRRGNLRLAKGAWIPYHWVKGTPSFWILPLYWLNSHTIYQTHVTY